MRGATVGSVVHYWLEQCEWIEDYDPTDDELRSLASKVTRDEDLTTRARAILRGVLDSDVLRSALSRSACDVPAGGEVRVRNEHAFSVLLPDENGREELWNGFIDRLVLIFDGDRVVRAEIIDHKTDTISDSDQLLARSAYYRPQLENYRRVVCAQYGLTESDVLCRLLFLGAGEVVDL